MKYIIILITIIKIIISIYFVRSIENKTKSCSD